MISDEVERMQQCCAEMRTVQPVDTRNVALPIRVEKRWQDARRIEKRWGKGENSWPEVGRDENLRAGKRSCEKNRKELKPEKSWELVAKVQNETEWERLHRTEFRRCEVSLQLLLAILFFIPIVQHSLVLETSATRLMRVLLVNPKQDLLHLTWRLWQMGSTPCAYSRTSSTSSTWRETWRVQFHARYSALEILVCSEDTCMCRFRGGAVSTNTFNHFQSLESELCNWHRFLCATRNLPMNS